MACWRCLWMGAGKVGVGVVSFVSISCRRAARSRSVSACHLWQDDMNRIAAEMTAHDTEYANRAGMVDGND
eukprot:1313879-Ditylum_brightwellii.AAC.1